MTDISLDQLPTGNYVVAVSGGIDSVVLLDLLARAAKVRPGFKLIVAHFDHGIREDSAADAAFVCDLAGKYGLNCEVDHGNLGPDASEAAARAARYQFLRAVQAKYQAGGIITAHHHDDVMESAVINLIRGTGRRGLSSLKTSGHIWRPLLSFSKADLMRYATAHHLQWREDSTNQDVRYLRNAVRHKLLSKADADWRGQFTQRLKKAADLNQQIEREIEQVVSHRLVRQPAAINRHWFIMLPHEIAAECLIAYLRHHGVIEIDHKLVERLLVAIKSARVGSRHDIDKQRYLLITKRSARIMDRQTAKSHVYKSQMS